MADSSSVSYHPPSRQGTLTRNKLHCNVGAERNDRENNNSNNKKQKMIHFLTLMLTIFFYNLRKKSLFFLCVKHVGVSLVEEKKKKTDNLFFLTDLSCVYDIQGGKKKKIVFLSTLSCFSSVRQVGKKKKSFHEWRGEMYLFIYFSFA